MTVYTKIICFCTILLNTLNCYADELHLYAGAGLRIPVEKIVSHFMQDTGHNVIVEYGGSGQILTRFELMKTGDVFLPGSAEYVDKLSSTDQIVSASPIVLHTPALVVRKDKGITTIKQLAESSLKLGMGDPKAIALGVAGEKLLSASGYGQQLEDKVIVRTTTIKQLLLYLLNGDIDAAVIGRSDAIKNQDVLELLPTPIGTPEEIVTVAVLKTSHYPQSAAQLADYFSSEEGKRIFIEQGFLPIN